MSVGVISGKAEIRVSCGFPALSLCPGDVKSETFPPNGQESYLSRRMTGMEVLPVSRSTLSAPHYSMLSAVLPATWPGRNQVVDGVGDGHSSPACMPDTLRHGPDHIRSHPWVDPNPEGIVHDPVRVPKLSYDAEAAAGFPHIVEAGVPGEVSGKEHARLDAGSFEMSDDFVA